MNWKTLTEEQRLHVEGTAAQLYERNAEETARMPQPWPLVDQNVKDRWRSTALRKLKTGEIDGMFKMMNAHSREEHQRGMRIAAGG